MADNDDFKKRRKPEPSELAIGRVPPQAVEAEKAVLGAMLTDRKAVTLAEDRLKPEDFYREQDAIIFQAILNLSAKLAPVDLLTVMEELRRMGRLDDVGGVTYLNSLPSFMTSLRAVEEHVKIVADKSRLRRLIDTAGVIADAAYTQEDTTENIVDDAEKAILQVTRDDTRSDFVYIGEAVQQELTELNRKYEAKEVLTGLPSGFPSIDGLTSGFQKGNLIIIAARPSMGKTAFVLNMAKNMTLSTEKKTVAFFSLEMSREELVQRLLCSTALVDSQQLRTGRITSEKKWTDLANAAAHFLDAPLYIDDTAAITVNEIRSKARRLKAEHGLDVIMIDYLQLMQSRNGNRDKDNRQQEIAEFSRSLKGLARELNVPVIALSQLSRAPETRTDHRPVLSDLRESGSIEQDADLVAFLYRPAYYNKELAEGDPMQNETEVILAKNRNGPVGTVKLYFLGQFTVFYEMTNRAEPEG